MKKGRSYKEINVGDKDTFSKTITETEIIMYAGLTGDFNPIHMDAEYSKKGRFGERVAHGTITLGLIAPIIGMQLPGPGAILLDLNSRFHAPVKIGDTVTAYAEVIEKIDKNQFIKMKFTFKNQLNEIVVSATAIVLAPDK
ncbi:MaoC family dehydratase [Salipaludibacillus sp. CF4.18]|uniref:MaoC family dehydratase n=1 Tax=Salipaludibacillus sp. CF4.18 TaxID=3373081 RepID=UPI003EE4B804